MRASKSSCHDLDTLIPPSRRSMAGNMTFAASSCACSWRRTLAGNEDSSLESCCSLNECSRACSRCSWRCTDCCPKGRPSSSALRAGSDGGGRRSEPKKRLAFGACGGGARTAERRSRCAGGTCEWVCRISCGAGTLKKLATELYVKSAAARRAPRTSAPSVGINACKSLPAPGPTEAVRAKERNCPKRVTSLSMNTCTT